MQSLSIIHYHDTTLSIIMVSLFIVFTFLLSTTITALNSFSGLRLMKPYQSALSKMKFTSPTPIQTTVIPSLSDGHDVWAQAPTGSGKTLSFLIPLLQNLSKSKSNNKSDPNPGLKLLILSPTRELSTQLYGVLQTVLKALNDEALLSRTCLLTGGVSINPQLQSMHKNGTEIVVATPGRLLDVYNKNALATLSLVEFVVLDEADKLLGSAFSDEVGKILRLCDHPDRQTGCFSATFPPSVAGRVREVLRPSYKRIGGDDVVVADADADADVETVITNADSDSASDSPPIKLRTINVDSAKRTQLLLNLINSTQDSTKVLVFASTKHATEHIAKKLRSNR